MPQRLDEGTCSYRGKALIRFGFLNTEHSAEVIVDDLQHKPKGMTAAYERTVLAELPDIRSNHRRTEQPVPKAFGIKWLQMLYRGLNARVYQLAAGATGTETKGNVCN